MNKERLLRLARTIESADHVTRVNGTSPRGAWAEIREEG